MAITGAGLVGGTLRIYLNQWVKIASGHRVVLAGADYANFSSLSLATAIDNTVENVAREMSYRLGESLDQKNFPPKPTNESMTLKQFTGRKFRDTEAECESLDTNTAKTSPE